MTAFPREAWDALAGHQPFMRWDWLHALETSGCVGGNTGWEPQHVGLWIDDTLCAALPGYRKWHSWGEYVFDWAWAQAYQRVGLDYYPKWLAAVPFTPVTGARLLAQSPEHAEALRAALDAWLASQPGSGAHVLFPPASESAGWAQAGWMLRSGVQFHWHNAGFESFEAFLATLTHDKRKKIRQERRKVAESGVTIVRKMGRDISAADWDHFLACYQQTYAEHGSLPYLNRAFFDAIAAAMPDAFVLVQASLDQQPVATALLVADGPGTPQPRLYGRWWGALAHIPLLHFELCYYQSIEHAIEQGYAVIEGGAQGQHKLARGFLPVATQSWHRLNHPRMADAVADYLQRERAGVAAHLDDLDTHSPYRELQ